MVSSTHLVSIIEKKFAMSVVLGQHYYTHAAIGDGINAFKSRPKGSP